MRLQVIPRTEFEFDQGSNGASTAKIPLATRIDTSRCVSGTFYVRLHAKSWTTGATPPLTLRVYNVSYTCDQPDAVYINRDSDVARVAVAAADAAPKLYVDALTAPIADQVQVVLEWSHGNDADPMTFAISVELELRDS